VSALDRWRNRHSSLVANRSFSARVVSGEELRVLEAVASRVTRLWWLMYAYRVGDDLSSSEVVAGERAQPHSPTPRH
jgi:hypothetical protein